MKAEEKIALARKLVERLQVMTEAELREEFAADLQTADGIEARKEVERAPTANLISACASSERLASRAEELLAADGFESEDPIVALRSMFMVMLLIQDEINARIPIPSRPT